MIATQNRAGPLRKLLQSILRLGPPWPEVVVVDQSSDSATAQAVHACDLVYLRCDPGLSRARNLGWQAAKNPLVAFLDDDCTVSAEYLQRIEQAFSCPRLGMLFGSVLSPCESPFVTQCSRPTAALAKSPWQRHRVEGLAGCMAARKEVLQVLAGFDERLGLGAPWPGGEEVDLCLRALAAGCWVGYEPRWYVLHHSSGEPAAAQGHYVRVRLLGTGAAYGKHLRKKTWQALLDLLLLVGQNLSRGGAIQFGDRSFLAERVQGLVRGMWLGLRHPLDGHNKFKPERSISGRSPSALQRGIR